MIENRDVVLLRIERKTGLLILAALAVVAGGFALAEQLTLTTSYPAPSGIYNQLITTGDSGSVPADTTFNRNAGNTILVPPSNALGMVGIGTSPTSKLTVAGGIQLGDDTSLCTSSKYGTLRWKGGTTLQVCMSDGVWHELAGAIAPGTLAGTCYCWGSSASMCTPGSPATACNSLNCGSQTPCTMWASSCESGWTSTGSKWGPRFISDACKKL